ncbi:MAG: hypothetical protein HKN50_12830 [Gammaproteobacteria bacterium]|nr:hypothetical protein [Gammaproteobacteria bacterium]
MQNMSASLEQKIAASAYLSRIAEHAQSELAHSDKELPARVLHIISEVSQYRFDDLTEATAEQFLIHAKQRFSLCWALSELKEVASHRQRGEWQSEFAMATIDFALRLAWHRTAKKHAGLSAVLLENSGDMPGLFIFGMGKLGGGDLNFSSDIDLVAYFDATRLPVPDMLGKSFVCNQVLQQLTAILQQGGGSDGVWRVDWRLRPDASASTLIMSTAAARDYYFYRASPWHRLALMKACVVAGDQACGAEFLDELTPFIWRQNLDYRALDELAEIKQRINLEHPALRSERQWEEAIGDDISGFNLKLGSGGIREVEFVANALQLVWGGKQYPLRTRNTQDALQKLGELGHLPSATTDVLATAYQTLRKVENAVQMLANQQTHLLPGQSTAQQNLLSLLGIDNWSDLVEIINPLRLAVHEQFEGLFSTADSELPEAPEWPQGLDAAAQSIVRDWEKGFLHYGVAAQRRHRLAPLANALARSLHVVAAQRGLDETNATIARLHDFFRSLPQGEQYFRLLARSPRLLDNIVEPLMYSPPMGVLLKQSPHIIDCYMQASGDFLKDGFDKDAVLLAKNYDERLERLRRFVNEHLYQFYAAFMQGDLPVIEFQTLLTNLAEVTIDLSLQVVTHKMDLAESPIAVLGLGKVGMRKMAPLSDLDLVFICDTDAIDLETASRFVSRLQTAIATPMREGIVYELDTRLRPSGRSGAPTVSIESFRRHQLQRAHTWEHIALVPSRVVAGGEQLSSKVSQVRAEVLASQRQPKQFMKDAQKMWLRIAEHRLIDQPQDIMFSKLRPGGLMQAEYLAACQVLVQAQDSTGLEFDSLINTISVGGVPLQEILQFWRTQQLWERLLGTTEQSLERVPPEYLERLLHQSGVDSVDELMQKKADFAGHIVHAMEAFFEPLKKSDYDVENWQEESVVWQVQ